MTLGPDIVLASRSPYRRELLARLLPDFAAVAQDVDESPTPGEYPADLATRLATLKARAALAAHPHAVIIGSDQVADLGGRILGKPGSVEAAVGQLRDCSGRTVDFHTAVCVLGPAGLPELNHLDTTRVRFRKLTVDEIRRYVAADLPLDCAGSFKAERRGVVLFTAIESMDPTAIQGLPLIWVADALRRVGIPLI